MEIRPDDLVYMVNSRKLRRCDPFVNERYVGPIAYETCDIDGKYTIITPCALAHTIII